MRFLTSKIIRIYPIARNYCAKGKDHYDSLNIKANATQTEVKGAYYKLSMVYHPDKNKGEEAAQRFRDITEAYEVLGNVKLRKLYDKGITFGGPSVTRSRTDPNLKYSHININRTRASPSGRTIYYDFDEWTRSHYGAVFAREMERKKRLELRETRSIDDEAVIKSGRITLVLIAILCMYTVVLGVRSKDQTNVSFFDAVMGNVPSTEEDMEEDRTES